MLLSAGQGVLEQKTTHHLQVAVVVLEVDLDAIIAHGHGDGKSGGIGLHGRGEISGTRVRILCEQRSPVHCVAGHTQGEIGPDRP